MLEALLFADNNPRHILCLGAHCDDIEIGCGGTLLQWLERYPDTKITWVVFTSTPQRKKEATEGAYLFTHNTSNIDLKIFDLDDGYLPYHGREVKQLFEEVKNTIETPDIIFTHYRNDLHQDHRKICELTWNTFRNHLILEYEIPKWDGDMSIPNAFIPLEEDTGKLKIKYLQDVYNTQQTKKWFTDDLFWSLMRIRGMECNSPSRIAEAFHLRKVIFS